MGFYEFFFIVNFRVFNRISSIKGNFINEYIIVVDQVNSKVSYVKINLYIGI